MRRPVSRCSEVDLTSQTLKYVLQAISPVTPTQLVITEHRATDITETMSTIWTPQNFICRSAVKEASGNRTVQRGIQAWYNTVHKITQAFSLLWVKKTKQNSSHVYSPQQQPELHGTAFTQCLPCAKHCSKPSALMSAQPSPGGYSRGGYFSLATRITNDKSGLGT